LLLPEDMDHNEFNLYEDFLEPISSFFKRHNLLNDTNTDPVTIPKDLFEVPNYMTDNENIKNKDVISKFLRKLMKI